MLAEHPKADISALITNPETGVAEAAGGEYRKRDWIPLNESMASDLKLLHGELQGDVDIVDRTLDGSRWVVLARSADLPGTYHLYDRTAGK